MNKYEKFMKTAIDLAILGEGNTTPNPIVGCVIVKNNKIIASGFHEKAGLAHAEKKAIQSYENEYKTLPEGCDLYVNLEPCFHEGRTPPCVDLIIRKKIKKVIIGMKDPNPLTNNQSIKKIIKANIEVVVGVLEKECEFINRVFIKNIKMKETYFSVKVATTMDGYLADSNFNSKWITNEVSRGLVHQLRYQNDGLLVGIGTVKYDNPSLNIRFEEKKIKNKIVVLDKNLEISKEAKLFNENTYENVLIVTTENSLKVNIDKYNELKKHGVKFLTLELINGHFSKNLGRKLYELGFSRLLVESGASVISSFFENNLVDDFHQFVAPKAIGGRQRHCHFLQKLMANNLNEAIKFKTSEVKRLKDDIYIHYVRKESV